MPEMSGIEACRQIKAVERFRDTPIMMVTVKTDPVDLQLAFAAGALDYIGKPINKIELLTRVRSVLRLVHEIDRRRAREQELLEVMRQLQEANQMLLRLSSLDGLTGITNRRQFDDFLDQEWRRAVRELTPLSLIMLDIDRFKSYNDTLGHTVGRRMPPAGCRRNLGSRQQTRRPRRSVRRRRIRGRPSRHPYGRSGTGGGNASATN